MAQKIKNKESTLYRRRHYALDTGCRIVEFDPQNENHQKHIARYVFSTDICRGKKVVDVACGTGYGDNYIIEYGNPEKIVISDISFEALIYAKKHYSERLLPVCSDAILLPLPNSSVDVFLSFETIEHIPKYREYLSEIVRILSSNGTAVISTPNKRYRSPYTRKPRNPFHYIEWDKKRFNRLLFEYFEDVVMYGQYVPRHPFLLTLFAPLFDNTLYDKPFLGWLLPRLAWRVQKYFGGSKYAENNTTDFLKKHYPRLLKANDEPVVFVAVCKGAKR